MSEMNEVQSRMFGEIANKEIFTKANDYGIEYLSQVFDRNVYPTDQALTDLSNFEEKLPSDFSEAAEVISKLNRFGAPATTTYQGGRYFGFVTGSAVPVGVAAKTLATFWDQNTAMGVLSPLAAKLETVCEKWLRELFQLPATTVAGFVSGSFAANFCGLAAARYRLLKRKGWDVGEKGLIGAPAIKIVLGKDAHSTVIKALALLGFGKENLKWIDVDDQGRIIPDRVPPLDDSTLLILQAGHVNSGSYDNFYELGQRSQKANAWIHVDGAFGLWAAAVENLKHLTKGIELANSWAVDGHKTLNTPYDCGMTLCNDKEAIVSALHMSGSYIMLSEERDGMFYTPEMSRRARVIELWATLKYLGKKGIDEMILNMHLRAKQFADEIKRVNGFHVLNEVVFNQVLVCCDTDTLTQKTMECIQQDRVCWVGSATWKNKKAIRVSLCSWATTSRDIALSVQSFKKSLQEAKG